MSMLLSRRSEELFVGRGAARVRQAALDRISVVGGS